MGTAGFPSHIVVALRVPEMTDTSPASAAAPVFPCGTSFPWFYSLRSFQWECGRQKNEVHLAISNLHSETQTNTVIGISQEKKFPALVLLSVVASYLELLSRKVQE